ncbi:hypothetical protein AB5N19_11992 [Seiridium cardinale]
MSIHHHFITNGTVDEQHDAGGSEEDIQSTSSISSFEATFPYTCDELLSIISEFYEFLNTFYLPANALKYPPPGGWLDLTPESTVSKNRIHYKCNVADYYAYSPDQLVVVASEFEWKSELVDLHPRAKVHTFVLANGYESGSRMIMLKRATGGMEVTMQAYDSYNEGGVGAYLKNSRRNYETLEMLPIPGAEAVAGDLSEEKEGALLDAPQEK